MKFLLKLILLMAVVASLDAVLLRPRREWNESQRRNAAPDPRFNAVLKRLARQEPTTGPAPVNTLDAPTQKVPD